MLKIVKNVSKKGNVYVALVYVAEDDSVLYLTFDNRVIADLALKNGIYDVLTTLSVGGQIIL